MIATPARCFVEVDLGRIASIYFTQLTASLLQQKLCLFSAEVVPVSLPQIIMNAFQLWVTDNFIKKREYADQGDNFSRGPSQSLVVHVLPTNMAPSTRDRNDLMRICHVASSRRRPMPQRWGWCWPWRAFAVLSGCNRRYKSFSVESVEPVKTSQSNIKIFQIVVQFGMMCMSCVYVFVCVCGCLCVCVFICASLRERVPLVHHDWFT